MPSLSLSVTVPSKKSEQHQVLVEEDALVSAVCANVVKQSGLAEEAKWGLYIPAGTGEGAHPLLDMYMEPTAPLARYRVQNGNTLILKEPPVPVTVTCTKTVLVDPAARVDGLLNGILVHFGYENFEALAADVFSLHILPDSDKVLKDVAFGVRRGACVELSCSCRRYQSPAAAAEHGAGEAAKGKGQYMCLDCGHYPGCHRSLGVADELSGAQSVELAPRKTLSRAIAAAVGLDEEAEAEGAGVVPSAHVLTLKSRERMAVPCVNLPHKTKHSSSIPIMHSYDSVRRMPPRSHSSESLVEKTSAGDLSSFSLSSKQRAECPPPTRHDTPNSPSRWLSLKGSAGSVGSASRPNSAEPRLVSSDALLSASADPSFFSDSPILGNLVTPNFTNSPKRRASARAERTSSDDSDLAAFSASPTRHVSASDADTRRTKSARFPRSASEYGSDVKLRSWAQRKIEIDTKAAYDRNKRHLGISIAELLEREPDQKVPMVVRKMLGHLRRTAMTTEGLFRVSAKYGRIQELEEGLLSDNIDCLDNASPHELANVLKLFLKDLPEPMLSWKLWPRFLNAASTKALSERDQLTYIQILVKSLSDPLQNLLHELTRFLVELLEHCEETKMNEENLSMVFGPLMVPQNMELADTSELIERTKAASRVLKIFLSHTKEIFEENECKPLCTVMALNAFKNVAEDELKVQKGDFVHVVRWRASRVLGEVDGRFGWFTSSSSVDTSTSEDSRAPDVSQRRSSTPEGGKSSSSMGFAKRISTNMSYSMGLKKDKKKDKDKDKEKDKDKDKEEGEHENVQQVFNPLFGQMVKIKTVASGFDPEWEELFMDDESFQERFGMSKTDFCCLPQTRRSALKLKAAFHA